MVGLRHVLAEEAGLTDPPRNGPIGGHVGGLGKTRPGRPISVQAMAHRLDLPGLKAALDDWPAETPTGGAQRDRLQLALVRAVTTSRFIRFVDGANSSGRPGDRDAVPITRSRQAAER